MLRIVARKTLVMNSRINYLKLRGMREKLAAYLFEQSRQAGSQTFMIPMNRNSWPTTLTYPGHPCHGSSAGCATKGHRLFPVLIHLKRHDRSSQDALSRRRHHDSGAGLED
jgi:hypothetical protein